MHRKFLICIFIVSLYLVSQIQAQDGDGLILGQPVTGALSPENPQDDWVFTSPPALRVNLLFTRTSGTAPVSVALLNQNGTLVISLLTNDLGVVNVPQLYLEGGNYRLKLIGDFSASTESANFSLSITPNDPNFTAVVPQATTPPRATPTLSEPFSSGNTRLEIGVPVVGEFTEAGQEHRYTFLGYAESQVTFGLSQADEFATFDPYIQLQAPSGEILIEDDNHSTSLDALIINFELPATGIYTLIASSATDEGIGRYIIAIGDGFILRDVEQGIAEYNTPIVADLEGYGVRDVWLIELNAGDVVSVSVENWDDTDPFDPMVEIVSPDNESLGFDDDSGGDSDAILSGIRAPVTGTYRIYVAAYNHDTIGTYRLWWQRDSDFPTPTRLPTNTPRPTSQDTPTATLIPSSEPEVTPTATRTRVPTLAPILLSSGTEQANVEEGSLFDRRIRLEEGQELYVFVEGHWGFDGVLEIFTPDGYMLDRVDDVGANQAYNINPRLNLAVPESGLYTIRVYGYESSAGEFTLTWRVE